MNLYAYSLKKPIGINNYISSCSIDIKDNNLIISKIYNDETNEINQDLILDYNKMEINKRYSIILPAYSIGLNYCVTNFDENSKLYESASNFYELYYSFFINGIKSSVNIIKTNADELFIVSYYSVNSDTISFIETDTISDVSFNNLFKKYSKDSSALIQWEKYANKFDARNKLLTTIFPRTSISYLDIQCDLLLRIVLQLLNNSSEIKEKMIKDIPNYEELLASLEKYSILNYKTQEEALKTIQIRKKAVREAQQKYYDTLKELDKK